MWGNSFSLHYALTGDGESGAAADYCARIAHGFMEMAPQPYGQHLLPFGIAVMTLLRYAKATGSDELLQLPADIFQRWPYDFARHNPATEPDDSGGDMTPNDTFNMKLVGACAMWLLGHHIGDTELKERGRDCVVNFVLPEMQEAGFWFYRPGSPEGSLKDGIQSHNHYDGFVKQLLSRLLMHQEWRDTPGVLATLKRGMDFSLHHLSVDAGRILKWELHPDTVYGPRQTLARYFGHAGMFCDPLYVLARWSDPAYLEPLQKSIQLIYDGRDLPVMADYWDNSWFYSVYAGLFSLSWLGVEFGGSAQALQLSLGEAKRGAPL
jgi:hypothetical protein